MIKIEALTLEDAFADAATQLGCSITEINIEVVQAPTSGVFGLFKKKAIIVAAKKTNTQAPQEACKQEQPKPQQECVPEAPQEQENQELQEKEDLAPHLLNDTIMPTSFVSDQEDDDEVDEILNNPLEFTADYDDALDDVADETLQEQTPQNVAIEMITQEVQEKLESLFSHICFDIESINVSVYDEQTLLVEFNGEDAALLIGKEGYRYKSLSYMLFNWLSTKYNVGVRLEVAEFLKNQEESMGRYLESVYETVAREGRAQTKILDGVLVQIALKALRDKYEDKYVAIRTNRDGLKYIIINDYHH
jgi:spoIIIJ-associated protein